METEAEQKVSSYGRNNETLINSERGQGSRAIIPL